MGWDKFTGKPYTITTTTTTSSSYETKVFDIDPGGRVVKTKADGSIPNIHDHIVTGRVKAAIIVHRISATSSVSILYLDTAISQDEEYAFRRIFRGFGAIEAPPEYVGRVNITINSTSPPNTDITVSRASASLATLSFAPMQGTPLVVTYSALGYSETSTIRDGAGSNWNDGVWVWSGSSYATSGTSKWDAPAERSDPD